jgi:hypothetical protein
MRRANELASQANEQTLKIANRQFDFGKQQMIYTQAADVKIAIQAIYPEVPGPYLTVTFTNIGHERATSIHAYLTVLVRSEKTGNPLTKPQPLDLHPAYDLVPVGEGMVAMQANWTDAPQVPFHVSATEFDKMVEADAFLEAKGRLTYVDGFETQTQTLCYRLITFAPFNPRETGRSPTGQMVMCGDIFESQRRKILDEKRRWYLQHPKS